MTTNQRLSFPWPFQWFCWGQLWLCGSWYRDQSGISLCSCYARLFHQLIFCPQSQVLISTLQVSGFWELDVECMLNISCPQVLWSNDWDTLVDGAPVQAPVGMGVQDSCANGVESVSHILIMLWTWDPDWNLHNQSANCVKTCLDQMALSRVCRSMDPPHCLVR